MKEGHLWSGLGLVAPLRARVSGRVPDAVAGISIDTRSLQPSDAFFAIKGDTSDGHDFVAAAFEKGAVAAVIDETHAVALQGTGPLYVVDDVLQSMQNLGIGSRARTQANIVAVTGSVGKTSTKEALRHLFTQFGATHASAASYNNHWGVPLTLARMPKTTQFGVFEIGMNHAGEITPLVAMVRPHVAIVTTVAPVHMAYFGSIEAIAEAKAEIFTGIEPGGTIVINRDIAQYELLRDRAQASNAGRVLAFGTDSQSDAVLEDCVGAGEGSLVTARIAGRQIRFQLGAPGRHVAMNAMAVLLAAHAVGLDVQDAAATLADLQQPVGRGQRIVLNGRDGPFTIIDESYNANPTSMRAAFTLLRDAQVPVLSRRVAVLGDMLELGPSAEQLHAELAEAIEDAGVDAVYAAGPLMKALYDRVPERAKGAWAPTAPGIERHVIQSLGAGDVVMIKGSNGSRMGPLVAAIKQTFAPSDSPNPP